jgi:hypothetical protein
MFAAITKWNGTVYDPRVLPEIVRNAFKLAEMEKPGAPPISSLPWTTTSPNTRPTAGIQRAINP